MSWYADEDWIGSDWHEGALEITLEQAQWGIEQMMSGIHITVVNGVLEAVVPPEDPPEDPPVEPAP